MNQEQIFALLDNRIAYAYAEYELGILALTGGTPEQFAAIKGKLEQSEKEIEKLTNKEK